MKIHNIARDSALLADAKTLEKLFQITCSHGDAPCALWLENGKEKSLSFSCMQSLTDNYAAYLATALPAGGYVAISMDTRREWFPTFWGVMRSGHNALLLDAAMSDTLAAYLLAQAGCHAIITSRRRALSADIVQVMIDDLAAAPSAHDYQPVWGERVALCTSGTTATSRIYVYSGEALVSQVLSSKLLYDENRRIVANENRRTLAFLPMHHVFGFMVNLLWCGFLGYANIYLSDRSPATILHTAQFFKPQLLITVPLLANNLCNSIRKKVEKQPRAQQMLLESLIALSLGVQRVSPRAGLWLARKVLFARVLKKALGEEIRCIILGGSHTPRENLRLLNALGYYTICGFGMTETAVTSVETSLRVDKRLSGSVGRPLRGVEYCVRPGGDSNEGEMLIRGTILHTGRMVDGHELPPDTDADGWYPTGDFVRLDREGRVFVKGRTKDVIINESGENVYPDELEDALGAPEGVEQLTVLGVKRAQGGPYEDITLVMNVGARLDDEAYLERLAAQIRAANQSQPAMKRLNRVLVTSQALPLVNGIKVKRLALKAALEGGMLSLRELDVSHDGAVPAARREEAATEAGASLRTTVHALYAEALEIPAESFDDDANFLNDLGGDSLQMLSVSLKVEERFGVLIAPEEYGLCTTVSGLCRVISEHLNGSADRKEETPACLVPVTRFEDAPEYREFEARQQALMASGQDNPYFVCHDSPLRDTSLMAGQEVLNFGSYNYVGMSGRPEVNEAAKAAIDRYGTSASGSRLLAGEKTLHEELEREIADWKHAESAMVLVGGHSTNVTFVGNFCGPHDLIVYDALAHNSIEQGCRLSRAVARPFPHNDARALESILRTQRQRFEKVLIVIEGVYSMDGDIADVPAFVAIKKRYGCFLMVDEAHSACVIGNTGGGVDEYFGLAPDDVDIKMGTLSKGLGTCGGYLAGRRCLIDYLRYSLPGFVFSVGLSPALAAGTLEAIRLLRRDPSIMEDLRRNIRCFAYEARRRGLDICLAGETAILPVMVGRDEDAFLLSNEMRKRGVFVPPAVYPAVPKNKARLRFCVISEHSPQQIVRALDTLETVAQELHIELPRRIYHNRTA